jgi:hypothetical protein
MIHDEIVQSDSFAFLYGPLELEAPDVLLKL